MKDLTFPQTVAATLRRYRMLAPGDRVLAAVSGGADSLAMLRCLVLLREEWDLTLTAAHVHHGLRGAAADADLALVEDLCRQWQVPLQVLRADVPALCRQTGEGVEACGRRVRYAFFEQHAAGGRIATAHTADDNAETMLLHLIRGASLAGLCGIPPVRGNVIRPLIDCTRAMTEAFCAQQNLAYRTDETNADDAYRRNFVRHHLLPLCRQINPAFVQAASRTAAQNRRDLACLDRLADPLLDADVADRLPLAPFAGADDAVVCRALARWLRPRCRQITGRHIEALLALVRRGRGCVQVNDRLTVQAEDDCLLLAPTRPAAAQPEAWQLPVAVGVPLAVQNRRVVLTPLPAGEKFPETPLYNQIDRATIVGDLFLRTRRPGDRIALPRRPAKTLKKLMNEQKIPPRLRDRLLVLCDEEGIVWIEQIGCSARCAPTARTASGLTIEIL